MRILAGLFLAVGAFAQDSQPSVTNATIENRTFSGSLSAALRGDSPRWFGYEVKTKTGANNACCWGDEQRYGCGLEGQTSMGALATTKPTPIELEGSTKMVVLFRVEKDTVGKVHAYSLSCPLDGGGLPFVWLTGVPADESLRYLKTLAGNESNRISNGALFAISRHDHPEAGATLVALAKSDPSSHTRSQALFWLAQIAGVQAAATITNAIENDPDTKVKRQAVFALSQLPKDEGIPKLIDIARTQRNPEVRKQAFFWLGQSHDPRALAFFEGVLGK